MNNHIRTSEVNTINKLRTTLWQSVYSNVYNLESLIFNMNKQFIPGTAEFKFNFCESTVTITSNGRPLTTEDVSGKMAMAYRGFISSMLEANQLSKEDADECYNNVDKMFLITFKSPNCVKIGL